MEENKNKPLDAFLKKQIQEIPLETPSQHFTADIMELLNDEKTTVKIQYKPLISWKVWLTVAAAIVAIVFIPFQKQEGSLLEKVSIDFSFLSQLSFSELLGNVHVSNTAFYGFLLFAIMILVQITYLKGYVNRKLEE